MNSFYTSELSPFGARLRMVAAMTRQTLPMITPPPGGAGSDAMKAISPFGQTPTVVLDDRVLIESLALMEYFAELEPHAALMPSDALSRARVRGIVLAHDNHVFAAMRPLLAQLQMAPYDPGVIDTWLGVLQPRIAALVGLFDDVGLAIGGVPSLADIAIAPFALLCELMARKFDRASPYASVERAREWWRAAQDVPEIAADNSRRQVVLAQIFGA